MFKKLIIMILDRLLDRGIRLYDMFAMDKKGNVFIFRPSEKRRMELKEKISVENIYVEGGRKVYALAEEAAKNKSCSFKKIYKMEEEDWLWAAQLVCRCDLG